MVEFNSIYVLHMCLHNCEAQGNIFKGYMGIIDESCFVAEAHFSQIFVFFYPFTSNKLFR